MKQSAERKVQEISQSTDEIRQFFEHGDINTIEQKIVDIVQSDNNPHSWLKGPKQRYLDDQDEPNQEHIASALA